MDLILLISVAVALLIILISIYFFLKRGNQQESDVVNNQRNVPARVQEGVPRRAQILRNQRNRIRATTSTAVNVQQNDVEESGDDDDVAEPKISSVTDEKMGAKKRAKLEAKAEKKAQREQELKYKEEKKKKDAVEEEERKKIEQKEEEEEKKREEEERKAREDKERKEYEEYLKIKEAFSVEEEGFEEEEEKDGLLLEFIQFIQDNKVVVLEDLANHFKMKTQQAIDRITELQKNNIITGVIDDRGKFIYISENELNAVAKFIRQRGRISITELAESSNSLINLTPVSS